MALQQSFTGRQPARNAACWHRHPPDAAAHLRPLRPPRRRQQLQTARHSVSVLASAGVQQRGKQQGSLLSSFLLLTSVPYSSYVPEPRTLLHEASAGAKQLWSVAILLIMSRASTPMRAAIIAAVALATVATLPPRLWRPQLARVGGLCALLFAFTAFGADSLPPVLVDRALPPAEAATTAAGAAGSAAAAAAAAGLPESMAGLAKTSYRYVLFQLGPLVMTRRSLSLAVAFVGLTFTALQSASLVLVTTPPEQLARALGAALRPLRVLGVPVAEMTLTLLLALRFMNTVFEESRNLALGLASRGIGWSSLGAGGTLALLASTTSRLLSNLMDRADSIAVAMTARGFRGPEDHRLYLAAPPRSGRTNAADAAVLLSLAGLAALSHVLR